MPFEKTLRCIKAQHMTTNVQTTEYINLRVSAEFSAPLRRSYETKYTATNCINLTTMFQSIFDASLPELAYLKKFYMPKRKLLILLLWNILLYTIIFAIEKISIECSGRSLKNYSLLPIFKKIH